VAAALDGVVAKLEAGALVADVGCGHGASSILLAEAFPASRFVGVDYHAGSIATGARAGCEPRGSATA
jgi:trans-aconitate methyltransferase